MSILGLLHDRLAAATGVDPELRPATKPEFGHFQSNVALRLAKAEGRPPREVAADIAERVDLADLCERVEIAGPGFLNLYLRADVLAAAVEAVAESSDGGLTPDPEPQRVVIDYPSANVAKQMHVGHLRTSIIGDCLNRVLTALGHTVIPQDHMGDWGRQFGMLVEQVLDEGVDVAGLTLAQSAEIYVRASNRFKSDEEFAARARARVPLLQGGDEETLLIWRALVDASRAGLAQSYRRLGIKVTMDDFAGESTYNAALPGIVDALVEKGLAVVDDGALCVFTEGSNAPMIVRNSAGGFGYSATDLASLRHRVDDLRADRILYVVDARQAGHFAQVFEVARLAGWLPERVQARHVGYGMVLGTDNKPFKTRDGNVATLDSLLDAAEEEAAPKVALAAVKYADLSNNLVKDYVFDVERMVQTVGDTGPYLQYAAARAHQVLARALADGVEAGPVTVLEEPAEQELALKLTRFDEVVHEVADTLQPHRLCTYLFELASLYSSFYEQCPVMKSAGEVRASRLGLCRAVRTVLATGLDLLGIDAPERM